jgi:hypothetical protein
MEQPTERITLELRQLENEHHDSCSSCGYQFKEADTAHLGYLDNGSPAYVCEKCSEQLSELAARRYFMKRPYEVPDEGVLLWRYLDFTKFVNLLSSKALYFPRADQFEDTFEGAKGLKGNKEKWDSFYLDFFREAVRNPPPGHNCELTDDEIDKEAQRLLQSMEAGGQHSRTRTFVSCWHENEHESEAMWRLYSSFLPNALTIRSTYGRLYRSFGKNPSIKIGRVQYLDLNKQYAGVNDAFWRKRKSFEHEREVRAVLIDHKETGIGKLVSCDLKELIEEVIVSPMAPPWFENLVADVSEKYGLEAKVSGSHLNDEPFF